MNIAKRHQRAIITAVNIGTILEWYELSLYAYYAPLISQLFFEPSSKTSNLISVFLIFALGYLIRPLGGIFFGRLGDRIGRRKALLWSIILMTVPTVFMCFLPTYSSVGILAPILLTINRLLQTFPAGGELPGSFCYLYESAQPENRKYMTSWGFVGNQLGIALAMVEYLLFKQIFPLEVLHTWGWRLSFLIGALIGLYGFYLRHTLAETPVWKYIEEKHEVARAPILRILLSYKMKILKGVGYSALTAVSFGALISFFPLYFEEIFGTNYEKNLMLSIALLILITIPLPFFGKLADKYSYKKILIYCTTFIILLILSFKVVNVDSWFLLIISVIMAILFSCLYAILPFLLTDLFPTSLRFSGTAITFNVADSFEGLTPVAALYLMHVSENPESYFWILLVCAVISLCTYLTIKQKHSDVSA